MKSAARRGRLYHCGASEKLRYQPKLGDCALETFPSPLKNTEPRPIPRAATGSAASARTMPQTMNDLERKVFARRYFDVR